MHRLAAAGIAPEIEGGKRSVGSLFSRCANPGCTTGWIRLWRNRRVPGFEGQWACSAECMEALVAAALRREMEVGVSLAPPPQHRVPMGLLLVRQGRITPEQLRAALEAQQRAVEEVGASVHLGEWLMRSGILSEPALTRARSAQWNCPVFHLQNYRPEELASAMPRFFAEALGALPVGVGAGARLCVAFSERIDRCLGYALERMGGLPVTPGIAADSEFARAQTRFLEVPAPRTRFLEAASSWVLVRTIVKLIESEKPVEARLVRVHAYYWLRLWRATPAAGLPPPDAVEDLLAVVGNAGEDLAPAGRSESSHRPS